MYLLLKYLNEPGLEDTAYLNHRKRKKSYQEFSDFCLLGHAIKSFNNGFLKIIYGCRHMFLK